METLADTGFIVALTNRTDNRHTEVRSIYTHYPKILVSQTVLAEVAYLLGRDAGIPTVVAFLKGLPASRFSLIPLEEEDIRCTHEILERYADSRIDFVDASIMALAERLKISIILTLDQRDFRLFRPSHCQAFTIFP